MKHISLEEWDRRVAPFLATIGIRAKHIQVDAIQIREWVKLLPYAAGFPTEAISKLEDAEKELASALKTLDEAIFIYKQKEKVS